jgi:hypothetical protein
MMDFSFDYHEVVDYGLSVQRAREKSNQRAKNAFLRKQGSKLLKQTKAAGQMSGMQWSGHVKTGKYKNSEHYRDTVKRGKVYEYEGTPAVRVYSYAPHAHLLEYGHRLVGHKPDKRSLGGRTRAFRIFESARKSFEARFLAECVKWYEEEYSDLW